MALCDRFRLLLSLPVRLWNMLRRKQAREGAVDDRGTQTPEGGSSIKGTFNSVGASANITARVVQTADITPERSRTSDCSVPSPEHVRQKGEKVPAVNTDHESDGQPESQLSENDFGSDTESLDSVIDPIPAQMSQVGPVIPLFPTTPRAPPAYRRGISATPTLVCLLGRYELAPNIIANLDFVGTRSMMVLFPDALGDLCRNHILHEIVPNSKIRFSTLRTDFTQERDRKFLIPVIKRIAKARRVFPENRIVFETRNNGSHNCGLFRPGEFAPASIDFLLPNSSQIACHWDLSEDVTNRRERQRSFRREGAIGRNPHALRAKYYKFSDLDSRDFPEKFRVNVFYKRPDDSPGAYLHAVSIPIDCLIQRLLTDVPGSPRSRIPLRSVSRD